MRTNRKLFFAGLGTGLCLMFGSVGTLLTAPLLAGEPGYAPEAPAACAPAAPTCTTDLCVPPADECGPAAEEAELGCLMRLFNDDCGNNWLADNSITLSGWVAQSFAWNPDNPGSNTNGPVTFTDRANEYQMNQLYLYMEKATGGDPEAWDLGGRVDLLYGTDYYFTQAAGLELEQDLTQRWNSQEGPNRTFGPDTGALYGLAMPQLYAEIYAPIGNGLRVKAGHFYTIIGYEVVPATGNFFVTHAYTMQYGEPFTHTGVLASYSVNDRISVSGGITNGWDQFDDIDDRQAFLGGVTLTSADGNGTLAFAIHTGDEFSQTGTDNRTMYSIVATRKFAERFTYVIQHDLGVQENGALNNAGDPDDAEWYGINQYLFYDINDNLKSGVRFEWFRDDDGVRVPRSNGNNFWQLTGGLNWKPADAWMVRPEVRWDWSDNGSRPYDVNSAGTGTSGSQFLLVTDVIYSF